MRKKARTTRSVDRPEKQQVVLKEVSFFRNRKNKKRKHKRGTNKTEKRKEGERRDMNKQDKKFMASLVFLQTGILVMAISISSKFWHSQVQECKEITRMAEIRDWLDGEKKNFESEAKIESLKNQFESKGIGVEE